MRSAIKTLILIGRTKGIEDAVFQYSELFRQELSKSHDVSVLNEGVLPSWGLGHLISNSKKLLKMES